MEDKTPNSPRERILAAVIDCIEKDGINNLTTRAIASEAGTNIASINYYFRTKDALVGEALQMSLDHMLEDVEVILRDPDRPLMEALRDFFHYLLDGTVKFPGVSMANLYSAVVEKQYDSPGGQAVRKIFSLAAARILQAYPHKEPQSVRAVLYQILSAVLFTMLAPGLFQEVMPIDFYAAGDRRLFITYLLGTLVASLEAA